MDIVFDRALKEAGRNVVLNGLLAFNRDRTASNAGPEADIGLLIRHPETGETEGGLTARMYYGWMFVELLFVPERRRGQGLGKRLMAEAERVARQ
jgi:GNAT superfamily N-acetyltransferase